MTHPQRRHPTDTDDDPKREDWQEPTDSGSGRPSKTTPSDLDDVDKDDRSHPGRKPNPTGLQA